jgi:hypothetical protein
MALDKRVTSVIDGSSPQAFTDRTWLGVQAGIANPAGAGPGDSVSVVVTFAEPLPPNFGVWVQPRQIATSFISDVTAFGFTVTLTPASASVTLAASTFDVMLLG